MEGAAAIQDLALARLYAPGGNGHGPRLTSVRGGITDREDRLEISLAALRAVAGAGQVRHDLVRRVRAQIAAGTYETPVKILTAVDRLAHELA